MAHALTATLMGMAARAWRVVITGLLLVLLGLAPIAPAFAAELAPGQAAPQGSSEGRVEGPRNPYDMEALRQFDAGSHRAAKPPAETPQPSNTKGS